MISTKNIPTGDTNSGGSSFLPKNLTPGTHECTLLGITMELAPFNEGKDWWVILNLEGPEVPGFEGFFIDNTTKAGPRHKGQVARVKLNEYTYRDHTTEGGKQFLRDEDILKDLKLFCEALGVSQWLDEADGKYETVEALIAGFDASKVFKDIKMHYTICGKEYLNKKQYTAHELFLPRHINLGRPYSKDIAKVQTFDKNIHIRKMVPKVLKNGFENTPAQTVKTPIPVTDPAISQAPNGPVVKNGVEYKDQFIADLNEAVPVDQDIVVNNNNALEEDNELPFDL